MSQENADKPVPPLPEESPATNADATKPSSSSSPATRRLSLLINKAKKSISQAADKVSSPTDSSHPKTSEPTAATADSTGPTDDTAAAAPASPTAEAAPEGAEKRRSRLVENFENLFHRHKSPVHEGEQARAEHAAADEETSAPASPPKDSMVDQMKRNPLINRFFAKKEEATPATDAPESSSPAEPKPDDVEQHPKASTSSGSASPLGRRLTQILRSLPKGRKKAATSSSSSSSSHDQQPHDETPPTQSHPAAAATTTTPIVQATA